MWRYRTSPRLPGDGRAWHSNDRQIETLTGGDNVSVPAASVANWRRDLGCGSGRAVQLAPNRLARKVPGSADRNLQYLERMGTVVHTTGKTLRFRAIPGVDRSTGAQQSGTDH